MTRVHSGLWRRWRAQAVVPFVLLASVGISALGSAPAGGDPTPGGPTVPTPLATSIHSGAGTWVTLPMGNLSQPLNTFWQLFFQPTGTTFWSDKVKATAVATNGGLVLASAVDQPFVAGVRPSHLLHFSPLISTDDAGISWSSGLLPEGLAASPGALSTESSGQSLALVGNGLGAQVLVSSSGLSEWSTLTTARHLASGSSKTCGLRSLTTVVSLTNSVVVGASCSRPGVAGIFAEQAGRWHLDPLALAGSLQQGRVEVLTMEQTTDGLAALLGISTKAGTAVVGAWTTSTGSWVVSPALTLTAKEHLVSVGPASGSGLFVISTAPSGSRRLAVVDDPGTTWDQLPPPPSTTATVAFNPASPSTIDAFTVHNSTMTVWALNSGSSDWVKGQVMQVAIEFGSSG